jgi:hypothetical protein
MNNPHIIRRTTDPVGAPPETGIHWINTTTNKEFFSVGTTSFADWILGGAAVASATAFTPDGDITSINVQNAIVEVRNDTDTKLGLKADLASPTFTGTVSGIDKTMIGLGNVNNTSDVNKPVSTAQQTALNLKADKTITVNGYDLSSNITLTNTDVGADPTGAATSVQNNLNTHISTGTHTAAKIVNTPTGNISSTDQQSVNNELQTDIDSRALDSNLISHTGNTSNPHSVTKVQVGLGNADNTSDTNKPVSTAQQTALNLKLDKNTSITAGTSSKITYDTKGLIVSSAPLPIDDLSNVSIISPTINQLLKYNGANWINDTLVIPTSAGGGVEYFLTATASGISGYDVMQKIPDSVAEVDEFVTVNNNTVLLEGYISELPVGGSSIDAGEWNFNIFTYVSLNTATTSLGIDVYSRTTGGTETLLFSVTTGNIVDMSVMLYPITTIQPAFTVSATDKLIFKFSATTNSLVNVNVHLVHSGNTHYSRVGTPLITRHNDLSTIQGGNSSERFHLTSSEYTGTGSGDFVRKTSPNITTPTGIVKADVGLSNVVNTDTTTTANITDSTNKRFVTDANLTTIGSQSGTNTGDVPVASNTEINTGTDNVKTVSALGLAGSGYLKPLVTIITTTGGNITLTAAQNKSTSFEVVGALTSNVVITVADTMAAFTVENLTTGNFTVTFKTAAGGSVIVEPAVIRGIVLLYCDGTDCEQVSSTLTLGKVQAMVNKLNGF